MNRELLLLVDGEPADLSRAIELLAAEGFRVTPTAAAGGQAEVERNSGDEAGARHAKSSDVRAREYAERALRESEERLRMAIGIAQLGTFEIDLHTDAVEVNETGRAIYGWRSDEALTFDQVRTHFHPDDAEEALRQVSAAYAPEGSGQFEVEQRIIRTDGAVRWIRVRGRALFEGAGVERRPVRCVGTYLDVTDRHRAEQRLATQYAVAQALAVSGPSVEPAGEILRVICENFEWRIGAFWVRDAHGSMLRCSEVWHRAEAGLREFRDATLTLRLPPGTGLIGRVWSTGLPRWSANVTEDPDFVKTRAGAAADLRSCFAFPVRLRGDTLGVLVFFGTAGQPDVELMKMFETLGSQIAMFIEHRRLEEHLRQAQKMEAVGQLAGGVAHDFNNILTVIGGHTDILMMRGDLDTGTAESLREIGAAAERAAGLTRQLLTFSRKQPMHPQILNLSELIGNLTRMLHRMVREDVALRIGGGRDLPPLYADPGMMEQIVMNLVVNARDAMPQGGTVTIGAEAVVVDAAHIDLQPAARVGKFVRLTVRDTGTGIAGEALPRIFEPFFTTKALGEGTGLGLATVHGIVLQHDGWIEVETALGVGTIFRVYLPARPDLAARAQRTQATANVPGGTETVLLVEDEESIRALTAKILGRYGYRVIEAQSGAVALAIWRQRSAEIDLLLSDVVMPDGVSGRDLVEELRSERPLLKVILASGYGADIIDPLWMQERRVGFLQKPFIPADLARAVRKALDGAA